MARTSADNPPRRILIVIPNWVGDVVAATPVLAALRSHFRTARITFLLRPYVADILDGGGWQDELAFWPAGRGLQRELRSWRVAHRLRAQPFDLAILLTNSFRSAWAVWHARARRRVGYARDGRGWLLTDRLAPPRDAYGFAPTPVLDSYIRLAEHVGCPVPERLVRLAVTPAQERAGQDLQRHYQLNHGTRYALVNPGAAFGAAKCWVPARFAQVCNRLRTDFGLLPVLVGAPGEAALLRHIAELAQGPVVCCVDPGTTLGSLKVLARDAALLVCNDTGPRHYGHAFNVPTVTIFGPTFQAWTDSDYTREIKLQARVECGPCQLPACPLDLRCMTNLTTDDVLQAVHRLLGDCA